MVYILLWCVTFLNTLAYSKAIKSCFVFILSLLFFMLIILRGDAVDRDYLTYLEYINNIKNGNVPTLGGAFFDSLVTITFTLGIPVVMVFVFYALALPIKLALFYKAGIDIGSVFLVYVGFFVYLHDFTQIRVSLAIAIAYFALYLMVVLKRRKSALILLAVSTMVHPSLIFLCLVSLFIRGVSFSFLTIALVVSVVFCYFDLFDLVLNSFITFTNIPILLMYQGLANEGANIINVFGLFPLLNVSIALVVGYYGIRNRGVNDPWIVLMMKYVILSQIIWFSMSAIPVLSGRISQIFLFSIVFVVPYISLKMTGKTFIISSIYSLLGFIAFLYKGNLLNDYYFFFS